MVLHRDISFTSLTTLRVGGIARFVADCRDVSDVREAIHFAANQNIPWRVLGEGSNVLASDEGFKGVVIRLLSKDIEERLGTEGALLTAHAGMAWDLFVREAAERALWGIENLAGIPGTVGAAPIQNIGAYGTEVRDTLYEVEVLDTVTDEIKVYPNSACSFGYRSSRFKQRPSEIILSVTFLLSNHPSPKLEYADMSRALEQGEDVSTPAAIGTVVRAIRARKFPDLTECGSAGSFFKNPIITNDSFLKLQELHPELPGYHNEHGVKVPLGFILDRVLGLRGYRQGNVRLYEHQALVLVADGTATSTEVNVFAESIASLVEKKTGLKIEREVQNFL